MGLFPGWKTKIPHAVQHGQKKIIKKKEEEEEEAVSEAEEPSEAAPLLAMGSDLGPATSPHPDPPLQFMPHAGSHLGRGSGPK